MTSEVERKITLMGHPISYVIHDQLQGHLTIFFKCISRLLYFLKKRTLRSFGMNTCVYKHVHQIAQNLE